MRSPIPRLVLSIAIAMLLVTHVHSQARSVIVGIYDNKPLVFMGPEGPAGLFIDVLEEVAKPAGMAT